MKTAKHRTPNAELRTPNEVALGAWVLHDGDSGGKAFDLEERLLQFASAVIDLSEKLPNSRAGNHVAGQVLRSGTSPYAVHGEAESAESREDFTHKIKICLKELRETRRWARLINSKRWTRDDATLLFVLGESEELIRIFMASLRTVRANSLRACLKILRGAAAGDFGRGQGGEVRASPQRAVRTEPTQSTGKRPAARRVFAQKALWLRCSSVIPPRRDSFVAPRHRAFCTKTAPLRIFRQALKAKTTSSPGIPRS